MKNKKKGDSNMDATVVRPCTPAESLEKSLIEMREMRQGKKPKRSWRELFDRLSKMDEEDEG